MGDPTTILGCREFLCIDPGGTTGYAHYYHHLGLEEPVIVLGQFETWSKLDQLIGWRDQDPSMLVVYEKPFFNPQVDPIVFEVTGAIKVVCDIYNVKIIDQPANVPSYIYTRYAEHLTGVMRGTQHLKDAFAHMAYLLIRRGELDLQTVMQAFYAGETL